MDTVYKLVGLYYHIVCWARQAVVKSHCVRWLHTCRWHRTHTCQSNVLHSHMCFREVCLWMDVVLSCVCVLVQGVAVHVNREFYFISETLWCHLITPIDLTSAFSNHLCAVGVSRRTTVILVNANGHFDNIVIIWLLSIDVDFSTDTRHQMILVMNHKTWIIICK